MISILSISSQKSPALCLLSSISQLNHQLRSHCYFYKDSIENSAIQPHYQKFILTLVLVNHHDRPTRKQNGSATIDDGSSRREKRTYHCTIYLSVLPLSLFPAQHQLGGELFASAFLAIGNSFSPRIRVHVC